MLRSARQIVVGSAWQQHLGAQPPRNRSHWCFRTHGALFLAHFIGLWNAWQRGFGPLTPFPVFCSFVPRHNSTTKEELAEMVKLTGFSSMDALIDATVPVSIRRKDGMPMGRYTPGMTESDFLDQFK